MSEAPLDLKGCRILVVDDVPANLDVLVDSLGSEGYEILVASDGAMALEAAAYSRPNLILLDVMMPGMDGYETCRRLKTNAELAATPVIFLTARDDLEGIVEGFSAGGVDYVTKPFKREEVLARIRTHLERAMLALRLAQLNAQLEEKVRERTHQLQLKVRELEGKDRIAQHLLTFRSLEETLALILEVVAEIAALERAVVYLAEADHLVPVAAFEAGDRGMVLSPEELQRSAVAPPEVLAQLQGSLQTSRLLDPHCALVPILRQGGLLGLIRVEASRHGPPLGEADLRTLESFALQAAVAVKDAQVRQDPEAWKDQLDEVLELHLEMEDPEGLDELSGDLRPSGLGGEPERR